MLFHYTILRTKCSSKCKQNANHKGIFCICWLDIQNVIIIIIIKIHYKNNLPCRQTQLSSRIRKFRKTTFGSIGWPWWRRYRCLQSISSWWHDRRPCRAQRLRLSRRTTKMMTCSAIVYACTIVYSSSSSSILLLF